MYRAILTLAWFTGTIYATVPLFSLVVRPLAKLLRARTHSPLQVIIPSWFIMMAVVYFMTWPWREAVLYRAPLAWLASEPFCSVPLLLSICSRLGFSHAPFVGGSGRDLGRGRRLVTSGIRQQIRHPIYLGHLCMLLAWTVGSGEIVLYGLTLFALLTGWPMIRQEEAELESRFGDEYRAYRRTVPAALIPRVLRFRLAKSRQRERAISYAKFRTCSHDAVIRVYDKAGNVIETHEHAVDFKAFGLCYWPRRAVLPSSTPTAL
jgi:protein-S-isoprenylcysteine O-methyltransferase Ste14